MSDSFLCAAAARAGAGVLPRDVALKAQLEATFGLAKLSGPLATTLRMDLAAGRLTAADYTREARAAGVSAAEVTATLKQHMESVSKPKPAHAVAEDTIMPAGEYYGRLHKTAVRVVDGIFVPAADAAETAAAAGSVEESLAWLRSQATWGARAAERLGPENDFLMDLDLSDTSRGGRVAGGKLGPEAVMHVARVLSTNRELTLLDLSDNAIGPDGAAHLAQALLASNRTLTELRLASNGLGDAGALQLKAALEADAALLAVDLRDNGIEERTKKLLRDAWGGRDLVRLQL